VQVRAFLKKNQKSKSKSLGLETWSSQATPVMTANSSRARHSIALLWARELQQTARNAFNSPEPFKQGRHLSENLF